MVRDRKWLAIIALAVLCAGIWAGALRSRGSSLELTFLDVGEGLCAVMRTPSGKIMVFDCGTSSWRKSSLVGERLVAGFLQRMGADRIDLAVLSHPHSDHVSGYAGLIKAKPPKLVLDIGVKHGLPQYAEFLKAVKASGATYRIARRGQSIDFGDGVHVDVLSPQANQRYEDLNENSMVLRITYRRIRLLLSADVGRETERRLIESGSNLRAQVLQVGHHGSKSATTPEWLDAVRPEITVISCGRGDEYGHPSREVVARLKSTSARVYRTDYNGAVTITTDGALIRVRTYKRPSHDGSP